MKQCNIKFAKKPLDVNAYNAFANTYTVGIFARDKFDERFNHYICEFSILNGEILVNLPDNKHFIEFGLVI